MNIDTTLLLVAKAIKFKTSSGIADQIRELERKFNQGWDRLSKLSHERVRALFDEQADAGKKAVMAGTTHDLSGVTFYSKSQLSDQLAGQKQALKAGLRHVAMQAVGIVRPEAERFHSAASDHVATLEA